MKYVIMTDGKLWMTGGAVVGFSDENEPPSVVTGVSGIAVSSGQINLSWNPATDDTGIAQYQIQYGTASDFSNATEIYTSSTLTTRSITGLQPGRVYYFRLKAQDVTGLFSTAYSQTAVFATLTGDGSFNLLASKTLHRFDSPTLPVLLAENIVNIGKVVCLSQHYLPVQNGIAVTWSPLNRTEKGFLKVRNVFRPAWTRETGVNLTGSNDLTKTAAEGFSGAYFNMELAANCSIEAKAIATNKSCAISLQTGTLNYNFITDSNPAEHCLVFGVGGIMSVFENGKSRFSCPYEVGDTGWIEKTGVAIRYYKVSAANKIQFLFSSRSKLAGNPKAVVTLFSQNAGLDNIFIYTNADDTVNNSVQYKLKAETIGVLKDFQDWENNRTRTSTAETVTMVDGRKRHSFFNRLLRQDVINVNMDLRDRQMIEDFFEFYEWHGIEKEFIFIDNARLYEKWFNFAGGLTDSPKNQCLQGASAQLVENLRSDYILK